MNERADATWIARSREETLFAALYHRHYRAIRDFCRRRVPKDVVDDVVAETFLTAWRRIDDIPRGDEGLLWLYGVAYRVIGHHWRSAARRRRLEDRMQRDQRRSGVRKPMMRSSLPINAGSCSTPPPASTRRMPMCCGWRHGNSSRSPTSRRCWASLPTLSSNVSTAPSNTSAASTASSNQEHTSRPPSSESPRSSERRCPVITDDEIMRLFELADPARDDDGARMVDAAGYLDALQTRSYDMTLTEITEAPTKSPRDNRWVLAAIVAAAIVLIVAGALTPDPRRRRRTGSGSRRRPQSPRSHRRPPPSRPPASRSKRRLRSCGAFYDARNAYDADARDELPDRRSDMSRMEPGHCRARSWPRGVPARDRDVPQRRTPKRCSATAQRSKARVPGSRFGVSSTIRISGRTSSASVRSATTPQTSSSSMARSRRSPKRSRSTTNGLQGSRCGIRSAAWVEAQAP